MKVCRLLQKKVPLCANCFKLPQIAFQTCVGKATCQSSLKSVRCFPYIDGYRCLEQKRSKTGLAANWCSNASRSPPGTVILILWWCMVVLGAWEPSTASTGPSARSELGAVTLSAKGRPRMIQLCFDGFWNSESRGFDFSEFKIQIRTFIVSNPIKNSNVCRVSSLKVS